MKTKKRQDESVVTDDMIVTFIYPQKGNATERATRDLVAALVEVVTETESLNGQHPPTQSGH